MDDRGVTFLVGQNAQDNHAIIDESTSPQDLWFHLQGESSSHVIAKVPMEVNEYARYCMYLHLINKDLRR